MQMLTRQKVPTEDVCLLVMHTGTHIKSDSDRNLNAPSNKRYHVFARDSEPKEGSARQVGKTVTFDPERL